MTQISHKYGVKYRAALQLVYSGEPPVVVDGMEVGDEPESAPANPANPQSQSASKPASDISGGKRRKAKESDSTVKTAIAEPIASADLAAILVMDAQADSSLSDPSGQVTEYVFDKGLEDNPSNSPSAGSTSTIEAATPSMPPPQATLAQTDLARQWLEAQGQPGQWLIQLAEIVLSEQWQWGTDLLDHKDQCLLGMPRTADALQLEANQFIKILDEKDWLVTDVLSPMRKVREIDKIRGLLLASEPSAMFKRLLASTSVPIASLDSKPAVSSVVAGQNSVLKAKHPPATTAKQTKQSSQPQSQAFVENEPATKLPPVDVPAPDNATPPSQPTSRRQNIQPKSSAPRSESSATKKQTLRQVIEHWMDELAQAAPQMPTDGTDAAWLDVEDQAIETLLRNTPGLTRTQLMRALGSHADFRSIGTVLQMRHTR